MKKYLLTKLAMAIMLLFFTGCSISMYPPLNHAKLNKNINIGIITLDSNEMDTSLIGTTIFNNEFAKTDIKSWDIATYMKISIENVIKNKSNLSLNNIQYDLNNFEKKARIKTSSDAKAYEPAYLKDDIEKLSKKYNLQYVLIVVPAGTDLYSGVALYKRQLLNSMKSLSLKVSYNFELYRTDDMKLNTRWYIYKEHQLDSKIWKNAKTKITQEGLKELENITKKSIDSSMEKVLAKMGLISSKR